MALSEVVVGSCHRTARGRSAPSPLGGLHGGIERRHSEVFGTNSQVRAGVELAVVRVKREWSPRADGTHPRLAGPAQRPGSAFVHRAWPCQDAGGPSLPAARGSAPLL